MGSEEFEFYEGDLDAFSLAGTMYLNAINARNALIATLKPDKYLLEQISKPLEPSGRIIIIPSPDTYGNIFSFQKYTYPDLKKNVKCTNLCFQASLTDLEAFRLVFAEYINVPDTILRFYRFMELEQFIWSTQPEIWSYKLGLTQSSLPLGNSYHWTLITDSLY